MLARRAPLRAKKPLRAKAPMKRASERERKERRTGKKTLADKRRRSGRHDPVHLAFVARLPCLCRGRPGLPCSGSVVAAHIRTAANSGTGLKPSDRETVPMCSAHHMLQHKGEKTFELQYGIDLKAEAKRIAALNPAPT